MHDDPWGKRNGTLHCAWISAGERALNTAETAFRSVFLLALRVAMKFSVMSQTSRCWA